VEVIVDSGGDNALWSTRDGGGGWPARYSLGGIIK